MCRKLFFLVSLVIVLGLGSQVWAASYDWDNGGVTQLWTEPNNWNPNGVPEDGDVLDISGGIGDANAALIDSTVVGVCGSTSADMWNGYDLGVGGSPAGGKKGQLNITDGLLIMPNGGLVLGTTAGNLGIVHMSGGTVDLQAQNLVCCFAWHDASLAAEWTQTGGEVDVSGWLVCGWVPDPGKCRYLAHGGKATFGGNMTLSDPGADGDFVDIAGGTVVVLGADPNPNNPYGLGRILGYVANGQIRAFAEILVQRCILRLMFPIQAM